MKKKIMDCALLSYKRNFFLLPMLALVELIPIVELDVMLTDSEYPWKSGKIPVWPLDLLTLPNTFIHPKLAIVRTMIKSQFVGKHAGLIFEGTPKRLKISQESITWIDEDKKLASLQALEEKEVTLFDLQYFSMLVEKNRKNRE